MPCTLFLRTDRRKTQMGYNHSDFTINLTFPLPVQLLGASFLRIFIFARLAIKFSSCEKETVAFAGTGRGALEETSAAEVLSSER